MKKKQLLLTFLNLLVFHLLLPAQQWNESVIIKPLSDDPACMDMADVNHDGLKDIVAGSYSDSKLVWYENTNASTPFPVYHLIHELHSGAFTNVVVADINNDQNPDVVCTFYETTGRLYTAWFKNDPSGNFILQDTLLNTYGGVGADCYLAVTDFDNDLLPDIAVSGADGYVRIFWNQGQGHFSAPDQILPFNGIQIKAGDLDGDGLKDLVVLSGASYGWFVWKRNLGNGNFSDTIQLDAQEYGRSVSITDLDGDGDMDLLKSSANSSGGGLIKVYINDSTGTFSTHYSYYCNGPWLVTAADLTGDLHKEIIWWSFQEAAINWVAMDSSGNFTLRSLISDSLQYLRTLEATYLNNDTLLDLFYAGRNDDKLAWMYNTGQNSFGQEFVAFPIVDDVYDVCTADFDNDGDPDVFSVSVHDNQINYFENTGNGVFKYPKHILADNWYPVCIVAADVNLDNATDLVIASNRGSKLYWLRNIGGGDFSSPVYIDTLASYIKEVFIKDLNGDAKPDILAALSGYDEIVWYQGLGAGNFGPKQIISSSANGACSVYAGDADGDLDIDVFSVSYDDDKLAYYSNQGNGTFGAEQILTTVDRINVVRGGDLDDDGDFDLILGAGDSSGRFIILENDGNSQFTERMNFSTIGGVNDIAINESRNEISYTTESGELNFLRKLSQAFQYNSEEVDDVYYAGQSISFVDLNNDSIEDILAAFNGDDKISWYSRSVVGVEELEFKNSFVISPNPVSDKLFIRLMPLQNLETIVLFNYVGQFVRDYPVPFGQTDFYISTLGIPAGIYFLRGSNKEKEWICRIIKM